MKQVLLIDNFDSFTYNLHHYLEQCGVACDVVRNNELSPDQPKHYSHIMISPGPGLPRDVPLLFDVIDLYRARKSIMGVCLGIQTIVEYYGGELEHMGKVMHGVASPISVTEPSSPIFQQIPNTFEAAHYHSWLPSRNHFPTDLTITAVDQNERIMAVEHQQDKVYGVQFHPESVLSEHGLQLIKNWLDA